MFLSVGTNWMVTVGSILVALLLMPFLLRTLGEGGYGTWTLIISMTGYLSLLAVGVPMASVRQFSEHVAQGDRTKLETAIGTCGRLYLIIGAISLPLGLVLLSFFASLYEIPMAWQHEARTAFVLMVFGISASFFLKLPEAILSGHHEFAMRNLVGLFRLLVLFGLTVWLLSVKASLVLLAGVQLICLFLDFYLCLIVIRRRCPGVRLSLAGFDWSLVRRIFAFSLYVAVLNAGFRLAFETNALVIGAFMSVGDIPPYTIANSLVLAVMEFIIAIELVVMPVATRLITQNNSAELRDMFLLWSKIAFTLTVTAAIFSVVLGPRFIAWWIGPSFERPAGEVLQILMLASLVYLPVRGVAQPILMALGKAQVPAIAFLVAGVMNLGLSVILVQRLGLPGVALGTAVPNVLFALVVLVLACRELEVSVLRYCLYVVPRVLIGAAPVVALFLWLNLGTDLNNIFDLVAAATATLLLCGVIWVSFVYRNDPYLDIKAHLHPLLVACKSRVTVPLGLLGLRL